ncbi:hypothetical protein [Comamonas kerstersii]|uniref:hypothetical protein n=1 Tax=Comamonas kerstersii TaxID=225992 RepID=UPI0026DB1764|nr:hypothetical protein [Comamonas kerstersii]
MSNNCPHCAREHSNANLTQFFTEVFNTLSELRPGWQNAPGTTTQCAVAAIRELAGAHPAAKGGVS